MSVKRVFAVDLGASGGKCFSGIFEDGTFSMQEVNRFEYEGSSFYIADKTGEISERTYWDDIFIYNGIIAGLRAYRSGVSDILDSIGIDTWGSDGQFVTEDGDMLGKIYCYRDHRLDNMVDVVKSRIDAKRMYEITGIHFQPFNISNQLYWFITNRKGLLRPGDAFLPISTVFYYYLGDVRKVDSSWASITQLMDAKKQQWSQEILDKLDIPLDVMPEIVTPGTVVGELLQPLADSLGMNRAKLVAVGSHDTASAFAAAPIENIDEALIISSGTWSVVGRLVPEPITSDHALAVNLSNEGGIGNVRLLKNCLGTWIVQELRRLWHIADGQEMDWDEITALAGSTPEFGSLIDPDDQDFYNPSNMEEAIVDYCRKTNQAVPPDRGACLRTVYESLALKYRVVNEQICAVCGQESKVVNVVGGGSKNDMLNQFTANALGLPVVAGPVEATAIGNMMVQALGLNIIGSMSEALPMIKKSFALKTYKPQNTEAWDNAFKRFQTIGK